MPRSIEQILDVAEGFLSAGHIGQVPLLAGAASSISLAVDCGDYYAGNLTLGGSEGGFLDFHGTDVSVPRANGEDDTSYLERIRNPIKVATLEAIEDAVERTLVAQYPSATFEVLQTYEDSVFLDIDAYCDWSRIVDVPRGFVIRVDRVETDLTHSIYSMIVAEVQRVAKAGAIWTLTIEDAV